MDTKLIISSSPHIRTSESVSSLMHKVFLALVPAYLCSLYFFGLGALVVSAIAMVSCVGFEYLIQKFILKVKPSIQDGSALLTGLLLAFNLPSNLPWWIIVIGSFVAIAIGKISFGGLGNNPFNPALVGRVFLLISFPVQMTTWPLPIDWSQTLSWTSQYTDAQTGATALAAIKSHIGEIPDTLNLLFGNRAGSLGEVAALALLIGGLFLIFTKVITWHIPVSILGTVAIFSGIFWFIDPSAYASPLTHWLTGGMMLGAIFMATDYVTSPMTTKGQIIYGIGIGLLTIIIRLWGAYPEGMSFAILIMNAFTPLINNYVKPKRFGKVKQNG